MTRDEARKIEKEFFEKSNPSEADEFLYIEAMDFLIETYNLPEDMMHLGGYYYDLRKFDLALKYYERAATYDYDVADECLGYIWYYGRTGEKDYKKAFEYYSRSMNRGNLVSAYKVADMYKNGYYVEADYSRYVKMIEDLYDKIRYTNQLFEPLPEIYTRLARIRKEQKCFQEAISLYLFAKRFLAQRISYNAFWGNLNIMKWLIDDLYSMRDFNNHNFDFFDLYYVLLTPHKVTFEFEDKTYCVESILEDENVVIHYEDKWYRDRDDFFAKACAANGEKLTAVNDQLSAFVMES